MSKNNEVTHTEGELFDMICDHMCPHFIRRDQIREMLFRTSAYNEEVVLVYTTIGKTLLIDENDLRKWRLELLINKLNK